jgi:hypothetical protein
VVAAKEAERKLKAAGMRPPELGRPTNWLEDAVAQGVITQGEAKLVEESHQATRAAIMVDDFAHNNVAASQKNTQQAA